MPRKRLRVGPPPSATTSFHVLQNVGPHAAVRDEAHTHSVAAPPPSDPPCAPRPPEPPQRGVSEATSDATSGVPPRVPTADAPPVVVGDPETLATSSSDASARGVPHPRRGPRHDRLPRSLDLLGNGAAWKDLLSHMRTRPHCPIVVWGPTGCGKSMGCRLLLEECGYRVLTLDGADAGDNHELLKWIRQSRNTRVNAEGEHVAVVLDDFESFTELTRREVASYLLKTRDNHRLGALVVTVTQFRDPAHRQLSTLPNVRLYAPLEHIVRTWFESHHPWRTRRGDGTEETLFGFGRASVHAVGDAVATRDLRRVETSLKWAQNHGASAPSTRGAAADPSFVNIFDATRRLLSPNEGPRAIWVWWAQHAEPRDVLLLKEHFPVYQDTPDGPDGEATLETTATVLDALSLSDTMEPRSYELHHAQRPFSMAMASLAVASNTRSPRVGALAPPPRLMPTSDLFDRAYGGDMPRALRDSVEGTQGSSATAERTGTGSTPTR